MKIKAEQKNSRQSPRKVRLLANQVKDLSLEEAFTQLALMERKGSIVLLKVMRQAVANAVHNHQLNFEELEIDKILVKTGPTYKRWQPVSRGRAHSILKRTCHVEVVLKTKDGSEKEEKTVKKTKNVTSKSKSQKKDGESIKSKKTSKNTKQSKTEKSTTAKVSKKKTEKTKKAIKVASKKSTTKSTSK
jgi:large subunit ribosomal protein L22